MKKIWDNILNAGIKPELSPFDKKSVRLINRLCIYIIALGLLSVCINLALKSYFFIWALGVAIILLSATFVLNFRGIFTAAKVSAILVITGLLLFMSLKGGYGSGLEYYFLSLIALPFFLFRCKSWIWFFQAVFVVSLFTQKFFSVHLPVTDSLPHMVFYVFNSLGSCVLIIVAMVTYKNLTVSNEEELYRKSQIIEEQNARLVEANKQLDFFSYSVSHDLKAPLRAIEGYSSLLAKEVEGKLDEDGKEMFEAMRANVDRMRGLIDNLLTYSRTSKKELSLKLTDMNALLAEVLDAHRNEIKNLNFKITAGNLLKAKVDAELMKHVFDNYVVNAIKYSSKKPNPEIEIGSYKEGVDLVYYVKDNGAGFDMKYSTKLFMPFQRFHSGAEYEGNGVGLSIVKNVIQRHGGRVWANAEEGKGATFYFSVPND